MTTAADIKAALLKHYGAGWRVFFEVSNDTGAAARRWVDAVAVGIWPSTGHEIVGIEIKVSRADYLREIADPAKAQAIMRYCTRWCLACPAGLVSADEVPATWGVLELTPSGIKRKKKPPTLKPERLDAGFVMALLRQERDPDMALVETLVEERMAAWRKRFDQDVETAAARRVEDNARRHKQALEIGAKLSTITGVDIREWDFDPAALAAAYLILKRSGLHLDNEHWGAFDNLDRHLDSARKALEAIRAAAPFAGVRDAIRGGAA